VADLSDNSGAESDIGDRLSDTAKASPAPWTIRGIPPEERNAAIEAAKRSDMTLGEWLRRAIRTEILKENQSSRAPVPVRQALSDSQTALSDVERIAASFRDLAAAGVPVSKGHAAKITRALVERLPVSPGRQNAAIEHQPPDEAGPDYG
jgi:hypothetical protein